MLEPPELIWFVSMERLQGDKWWNVWYVTNNKMMGCQWSQLSHTTTWWLIPAWHQSRACVTFQASIVLRGVLDLLFVFIKCVCSLHPRFYFSLRDSSHLRADTKGNERHVFGQSQQHSNQSWNEIRGARQFQKPTPTKAPMIGKCHPHQGLIYPWPIVWEKPCLDLEQCTLGKMKTMYIIFWHINEIYWSFPIYSCVAIY